MKEIEKWAAQALNQVLETMFFATAEPMQKQEPAEIQYNGRIDFQGSCGGRLRLHLSERLALILAGNFCGAQQDQFSEAQIEVVVKELTNMVAGSFLALAENLLGAASLSLPEVLRSDGKINGEDSASTGTIIQVEVDGEILTLQVSIQPGRG